MRVMLQRMDEMVQSAGCATEVQWSAMKAECSYSVWYYQTYKQVSSSCSSSSSSSSSSNSKSRFIERIMQGPLMCYIPW